MNNEDSEAQSRMSHVSDLNSEKPRKSQVEIDTNYEKLHLNKGAEGYEMPFERNMDHISKMDPTFNDPKLYM